MTWHLALFLAVALLVAALAWLLLVAEPSEQVMDEEPTLDTRGKDDR